APRSEGSSGPHSGTQRRLREERLEEARIRQLAGVPEQAVGVGVDRLVAELVAQALEQPLRIDPLDEAAEDQAVDVGEVEADGLLAGDGGEPALDRLQRVAV